MSAKLKKARTITGPKPHLKLIIDDGPPPGWLPADAIGFPKISVVTFDLLLGKV